MNTNKVITVCTIVTCVTMVLCSHHIASSQQAVKDEVTQLLKKFESRPFAISEAPLVEMIRSALKEGR